MTPELVERVGNALERAWLKIDSLPPIIFSQAEADALATAALEASGIVQVREALERISGLTMSMFATTGDMASAAKNIAAQALSSLEGLGDE